MAFTVEDGTGVAGANAYIEVAYADAYFTDRGVTAWTGDTSAKQGAIIRATDYIETRWGDRFKGSPEFLDPRQPLGFPRHRLYDRAGQLVEGIPENLKKATAEYALRALAGELMPDPVTDASGGMVIGNRQKVGPIETEVTYSANAGVRSLKPYPAADRLLSEYLTGGGARAVRN
jgi:hypothetical protein